MSVVAILGAGAGGASACVELGLRGETVRLWNRSPKTLEPFQAIGGVEYEGVLGEGKVSPDRISTDLPAILEGADTVLFCLPTTAHYEVAGEIAGLGNNTIPLVLNPGHTGGALEVGNVFRARGMKAAPLAEFSTLTYVARKYSPARVTITGAAGKVRLAAMPGGGAALEAGKALFPSAQPVADVLSTSLSNVNMVLHPPGAVLGAAWVEATGGDFTFYVQGMTPGVARVMEELDEERRAVARAFNHDLPSLIEEMAAIGTVEASHAGSRDFAAAISAGEANRKIKAPDSLDHRYYREDFGHGLLPFLVFAEIAGVETPVASSLLNLGVALAGGCLLEDGRTAERMGIAGLDRDSLIAMVKEGNGHD